MTGARPSTRRTLCALVIACVLVAAVPALAVVPPVTNAVSPSHPSDTTWYSDDSPDFSWDATSDLTTLLGSIDTSGNAFDVTVAGDMAYVADQAFGMHVMDVSEPGTPTLLGTYDSPGYTREIVIDGDLAYIADRHGGLGVIDISQPGTPTAIGSYPTAGYALGVAVSGKTAYVADQSNGLVCVDVSDSANPALLGSAATTGTPRHVAVAGDTAYLADKDSGLQVFDVADPSDPQLIGSLQMADDALGVAVSGDAAYVAAKGAGLQVVDVSDPSNPSLLGSCETSGSLRDVTVDGDVAYVADKDFGYMHVIDISQPSAPVVLSTQTTPGQSYGVTVSGHTAYVADWGSGLQTIRVSEPATPTLSGSHDTPDTAFGIAVDGDVAYVADLGSGLQTIDISDPSVPTTLGTCDTPSSARDVVVSGNTAYVADNVSGLQLVDVSDPSAPTTLGAYDTPGYALAVDVAGDRAYVADHNQGLQIVDVSQPGTPTVLGNYNTPGLSLGVTVAGDTAYVADHTTMQIIDVSEPGTPTLLSAYTSPGSATTVRVAGDIAYLADKTSGLHMIDVSEPGTPTLLGTYDSPDVALRLSVAGDVAYLADKASGLQVVDVSDPTTPSVLGSYVTSGDARDVVATGDMAYVAAFDAGLQAINVAEGPLAYSYTLDENPGTVPDTAIDGTSTAAAYVGQPDGTHWFHVRAVGLRREAGEATHRRVMIDTTPPVTTSDAVPDYSGAATIGLTPTDALSGVMTTYYKLDGAASWQVGTTIEVESAGTHTLTFYSEDNAGNIEATQTVEFYNGVEIVRRGGRDRYAVAVDASRANFDASDDVILATGWTYADALSASGLAGCLEAPILVTLQDRLPAGVEAEIVRLGATKVTIVGGPYSVAPSIETHLREDLGLTVERIGGGDRYVVSAAIAERVRAFGQDDGRAFLASGEIGADALSLSPVVYQARAPLILTRRDVVPGPTEAALRADIIEEAVLAGGPVTVTDETLATMSAMAGSPIMRVWGADRYVTAARVAEYGITSGISTYGYVGVSNGADEKFADSLCGGPAVGIHGGVMTLTQADTLPSATRSVLTKAKGTVVQVQVFGGPKSVTENVVDEIRGIVN